MCRRCRRAQSVCYCDKLPQLPTKTRVVILQHPRERDKAIGTARMASLSLPDSELHVGVRWDDHPGLARALADETRPAALLFPGPGAKDILTERPPGPITLVVVDGTWSQAKTVVRDNPILQSLPRYAFVTPEPSQYRIRKEPNDQFVSTIEALMHVLGVLEGDRDGFRALLEPFRAMVDMQLHAQATRPQRRVRVERGPRPDRPRLPEALTTRFADLVCVVGEANAWPYKKTAPQGPDELVHWVAIRPSTGERFEQLCTPQRALSPNTTFHSRLAEADIVGAGERRALFEAFAAFVRPTDVIAAWGHYGPNLYRDGGGTLAPHLDLRALCQRLNNKKFGSLEDAAATIGAPRDSIGRGRGGSRLAALVQLVEHWRATYPR